MRRVGTTRANTGVLGREAAFIQRSPDAANCKSLRGPSSHERLGDFVRTKGGRESQHASAVAGGSKSSKASPVSDRQPPHLNTTLGRATLPGRATRAKCWFT
jgi:hypothetical protein